MSDPELLAAALEGLEIERQRVESQIAEIRRRLGARSGAPAAAARAARGRRPLSAAARKRIAEAQKKRWAAYRKQAEPQPARKTAPKKAKKVAAKRKRAGRSTALAAPAETTE